MKSILKVGMAFIAVCFVGCGFNTQLTSNHNLSQTQVLLQNGDFRVVGKAMGEASATYILGIGGLSKKAVYNNAVADMFNRANLSGSQTIVHINVHQHMAGITPLYIKARYIATGTIIEFASSNKQAAAQNTQQSTVVEPTNFPKEVITSNIQHAPIAEKVSYKICDYYRKNEVDGIVVSASEDGMHGKIIFPIKEYKKWARSYNTTNANNSFDGMYNCRIIYTSGPMEYPIVTWCNNIGTGWYIPSAKELGMVFENIDTINKALLKKGYNPISQLDKHWTSTETSATEAIAIVNGQYVIMDKKKVAGVIAMAKF